MMGDAFEDEKVVDYPTVEEGFYTGVLSDMYKNPKNDKGIIFEFLVIQKDPTEKGGAPKFMMDVIATGKEPDIALIKLSNGEYFTLGIQQRVIFNPIDDSRASYIKSFLSRQRKLFAVALNCYDEASKSIKWSEMSSRRGNVFTFLLAKSKKDTRYVNIDIETLFMKPNSKVNLESINKINQFIKQQREERTANSGGTSSEVTPEKLPF